MNKKKTHWIKQQYEETLIFHPHFHLKAFWICRHFQSILNIIKVIKMENFSLTLKHQKLRQNLFSCITYSLKSKAGICGLPSHFHCIYFVLDRQAFDGYHLPSTTQWMRFMSTFFCWETNGIYKKEKCVEPFKTREKIVGKINKIFSPTTSK